MTFYLGGEVQAMARTAYFALLQGEKTMLNENTLKLLETALTMDATATEEEKRAVIEAAKNPVVAASDKLITIKQAAEMLAVHEKTVWNCLIKNERLHVVAIGAKGRRVRLSEVQAIIDGNLRAPRSYCPRRA